MSSVERIEADEHMARLLEHVEHGQEVIITRSGRDVARVLPATFRDPERVKVAIASLIEFGKGRSLGGLAIKDLINEGRKY